MVLVVEMQVLWGKILVNEFVFCLESEDTRFQIPDALY